MNLGKFTDYDEQVSMQNFSSFMLQ